MPSLSRRQFVLALGASTFGLLSVACGGAARGASPSATASTAGVAASVAYRPTALGSGVKVKFGSYGFVAEAGTFAAIDNGYFGAEGLDIELVPITASATDLVGPVVTNQLQVAAPSPDPGLLNAAARDITVKIVGFESVLAESSISAGFLVRQDLLDSGRYKEPKDLKGLTVALGGATGGQGDVLLNRWLARGGLSPSDITRQGLPFPQMPAAMANKAIDACHTIEPYITVMENQGTAKFIISSGQLFPGFPGGLIVMSPGFAQEQPEAAKRFMVAWLRGQRDYWHAFVKKDVSPDAMYKIIANHTPFKEVQQIARSVTFLVEPNGDMPTGALSDEIDAMVQLGSVKQKPDFSKLIDSSFAQAAVTLIGRV